MLSQRFFAAVTDAAVWQCGFRPFFLGAALCAVVFVPAWLLLLAGWLPAPAFSGGVVAWHAHELILGFGLAAVAGFTLTAIPEFTSTPAFARHHVIGLFGCWLGARIAVLAAPLLGLWPLVVLQALLCLWLLALLTPRVWHEPSQRQLDLWAALALLLLAVPLFAIDQATGAALFAPLAALRFCLHLLMLLIVLALARISMRVVNRALDERGDEPDFIARPPRRQIAALLIMLHALAALFELDRAVVGWLALGAGAGCLGLLADWPHGAVLRRRWVALLYALPWLLGLGYLVDGAARLGAAIPPSAGIHLLAVGALGLAVFSVLCIAGRSHAGLPLDERRWLSWAAALLLAAALLRALAGAAGWPPLPLWWSAGVLWTLAFALWIARIGIDLARPRMDGTVGCDGPATHD